MSQSKRSPNSGKDAAPQNAPPSGPAAESKMEDLAAPLTSEQEDKVRGGLVRRGGDDENTLYGIQVN